jgi:hypothetical protein
MEPGRALHRRHVDQRLFCSQEVPQVRTDTRSRGRVVLAGDAAHCVSPYSGMVGAYRPGRREINRHPDDLPTAPANYGTVPRPFVDEDRGGDWELPVSPPVQPRVLGRLDCSS